MGLDPNLDPMGAIRRHISRHRTRRTPAVFGRFPYRAALEDTRGTDAGAMFKTAAGIDIQPVPYKGDAGIFPALITGKIQVVSLSETHARIYWWCSPPKIGTDNI
jgi:hypothetical protein